MRVFAFYGLIILCCMLGDVLCQLPGEFCSPPLHSISFRMTLVTLALGANDAPPLFCICDVVTTRCTVYSTDDTFGDGAAVVLLFPSDSTSGSGNGVEAIG